MADYTRQSIGGGADNAALRERFARLGSCSVGDVLDVMGYHNQILNSGIRAVAPGMRIAGPAFCIVGEATPAARAPRGSAPGYEMFRHMYEGCVAVVDTGVYMVAGPWGENTALSARMRGCGGAIIDGGTRDAHELQQMGFPAFARFASAARVEGRWTHLDYEVPVVMSGQVGGAVVVEPGDMVVADADGVVIVPAGLAERVADDAEEVTRVEEQIRDELKRGDDRADVYARHDRYAHVGQLQ